MVKGSKASEVSRKKMSEAKKGKPSTFKGKKLSLESREKMSLARRAYFLSLDPHYSYEEKDILADDRKKVRRERVKKYGGFHSVGEWQTLKAQYNWTCPACQKQEPKVKLTKDHIVPISRGGSDNIENIQPLCASCNSRKSTKTVKY